MATVARLIGDIDAAEDAMQDACVAALAQWPKEGTPANPGSWLVGTARHKALDRLRREQRRSDKEVAAVRELGESQASSPAPADDDQLSLIFACCHPALDPGVRVPLTLRESGGQIDPGAWRHR